MILFSFSNDKHEPVNFDKFFRSICKIKKKITLLMKFFPFYMEFFRTNKLFHILKFSLNTCNVIFYSIKGKFKFNFQHGLKNEK